MILLADATATELSWRVGIGLAGLLTGGLAGSILTQVMAWLNSRKQPIYYKTEVEPLLPRRTGVRINAQATIDGKPHDIMRVSIITVEIVNTGRKDFAEFDFSVLVSSGERVLSYAVPDPTPFHIMEGTDGSVAGKPASAVKFTCKPFNRGDTYSCKLIVVSETDAAFVQEPKIGSHLPVTFVESPSLGQMILDAARRTRFSDGIFTIRI